MIFNNRTYDILKWVNAILLPALITLTATIGKTLEWKDVLIVVAIANAVNTFLGSILGVSNYQYYQEYSRTPENVYELDSYDVEENDGEGGNG